MDTKPQTNGQTIAYLRVSTVDQNLDRQEGITEGADRVFRDKASGGSRERPALTEMMAYARSGDTVVVYSLDRLARSITDLNLIVEELVAKGVRVQFVKENLTFSSDQTTDALSKLLFNILGSFAEFERGVMRERQREGIAAAKLRGAYRGRKRRLTDEKVLEIREKVEMGIPISTLARKYSVSRATIYSELNQLKDKEATA